MNPLQQKFATVRKELNASLIEREDEIDLCLTALVAQEHLLLVGPPGTAKSLLLDSVMGWMGGSVFSCLVTKFTTPEEIFGMYSLKELKEDRYVRLTKGKLPEAHGAFIDEVMKGSSAILNTLLKIVNEGKFDDGSGEKQVPLMFMVGASNEWPSSETRQELGAFFDRWLFRKKVLPIRTAAGRQRLISGTDHRPVLSGTITPLEVKDAKTEAKALDISPEAMICLEQIILALNKEGIYPGDRRLYKSVQAAKAWAWLHGADEVMPYHLECLGHTLWVDPTEQPEKCNQIVASIANPVGHQVQALLMEAEEIVNNCNPRELAQAATATAKLGETLKKLNAMGPAANGRAERVKQFVKDQAKRIRAMTMEAL